MVGSASQLDVSNNYFGNPKNKEIEKTFNFVSANFRAPTLFYNNVDNKPSAKINGHFYKVLLDGEELSELLYFEKLKTEYLQLILFSTVLLLTLIKVLLNTIILITIPCSTKRLDTN